MDNSPNADELTLVQMTQEDIPAYISIEQKVAGARIYSPMLEESEVLEEMAKGPVYLIKKGEEVVGDISYEIKPDGSAYLSGLAIDPKYQGQGFARKAVEKVLLELREVPKIELLTHPENIKALNLYESLGFQVTERKENYFGDGEPRLVLVKNQE